MTSGGTYVCARQLTKNLNIGRIVTNIFFFESYDTSRLERKHDLRDMYRIIARQSQPLIAVMPQVRWGHGKKFNTLE
ncbi:MAG: hypothetical protein ACRECH_13245 [Nitrososphaerales archaeon]